MKKKMAPRLLGAGVVTTQSVAATDAPNGVPYTVNFHTQVGMWRGSLATQDVSPSWYKKPGNWMARFNEGHVARLYHPGLKQHVLQVASNATSIDNYIRRGYRLETYEALSIPVGVNMVNFTDGRNYDALVTDLNGPVVDAFSYPSNGDIIYTHNKAEKTALRNAG